MPVVRTRGLVARRLTRYTTVTASRQPQAAIRAAVALAARIALCQALGIGERQPGARLTLEVSFHRGRKHLPIVTLKRAA